jgi:hypothetical protein
MEQFFVQGVVKNGQVVLDAPLDLPDGFVVYVSDEMPENTEPIQVSRPATPEERKQTLLVLARRLDLMNDPDWEVKLKRSKDEPATPRAGAA